MAAVAPDGLLVMGHLHGIGEGVREVGARVRVGGAATPAPLEQAVGTWGIGTREQVRVVCGVPCVSRALCVDCRVIDTAGIES